MTEEKQEETEWPKITGFKWSMVYGMNPCATICIKCRKPTGRKVYLGKIQAWRCLKCGQILVAHNWETCKNCGNGSFLDWKDMGECNGEKNSLPLGMCPPCAEGMAKIQEGIRKGGVGWRCIKCGAEGFLPKDDPSAKRFRSEFPDKFGMNIKPTQCPECNKARLHTVPRKVKRAGRRSSKNKV